MPESVQPESALTPSAYLELMAGQITALSNESLMAVNLRGIPEKRAGELKDYGGFVYANVRDPRSTEAIDLKIPTAMVPDLAWGTETVFCGIMRYKVSRGNLQPEFRADSIAFVGGTILPSKSERIERWRHAIERPKQDIGQIFLNDKPRIKVVTGVGSVAVDDIRSQLLEWEKQIDLEVVRVSMDQALKVSLAIRDSAEYHLVVLTRGGGSDVHLLDNDEVIDAITSAPTAVAVAVGHASDDLILNRVADQGFATPTAFGTWLRRNLEQKSQRQVPNMTENERMRLKLLLWKLIALALVAALALVSIAAWVNTW